MEENDLNRLIRELRASDDERADEDPSNEDLTANFVDTLTGPRSTLNEREQRLLDQSQRWISFLSGQAEQLTAMASWLYDQLLAVDPRDREIVNLGGQAKEAVIDRLEWTLRALNSWIRRAAAKG